MEQSLYETEMANQIAEICVPMNGTHELRIDLHNSKSHPANSQEKPITIFKINKHLMQDKKPDLFEWLMNDPDKARKIISQVIQARLEEAGKREVVFTDIPDTKSKNSFKLKLKQIDQHHLEKSFTFDAIIKSKTPKQMRDKIITWICSECGHNIQEEITIEQTLNIEKPQESRKACFKCFQTTGKPKYLKPVVTEKSGFIIMSVQDEQEYGEEQQLTKQLVFDGILSNQGFQKDLISGKKIRILATISNIKLSRDKATIFQLILKVQGLHEELTEEEIKPLSNEEITKLKTESNNQILKFWATKLYTSLQGYDKIKESIITQLVGVNQNQVGSKRNKTTINILLIGDAGAGKSTFLKLTQLYGIKTRYANASSSSGVGMTASVIKNEITGTNMVDAGAIPLADGGILSLDEIDKIHEDELKKLHEAMTENSITINKAGCHETLSANTSILGAGNPKNGVFDSYSDLQQQVTIPITILNRFELIYLIRDTMDEEEDLKKVNKILQNHREQLNEPIEFFKRYLKATAKIDPLLSEELKEKIAKFYIKIRKENNSTKILLNTRSVETIIRLTTAHARTELRDSCIEEDLEWATKTYLEGIGLLATDSITGELDIQKLETGTGKSERKVLDIIIDYLNEQKEPVTFEDIHKQLDSRINQRQLEEILAKLTRDGDIFCPNGKYKKI